MIVNFIFGLFIAFILTYFNVDNTVINVAREWFNVELSISGYYVLFGIMAILSGARF